MTAPRAGPRGDWRTGLAVGLHYDFHARADDLDIGRDVTVGELVELWSLARPDWIQCDTKGHAGYASYPTRVGTPAPHLAGDPLRVYRDASRQLGLPLVSHYCSLMNDLEAGRRGDWARHDADGRALAGHVCITGTHDQELMIPQLLELIDEYDIDGVWIDGDIWLAAPCYCERCQEMFRRGGGIDRVPRKFDEPGWDEWLDFHRRCHEQHVRRVTDAVHRRKPECLVTVNWAYTMMQPDPVTLPVDSLSGDIAHVHSTDWHECEARFLDGRGKPWDLQLWAFTIYGPAGDLELRSADHLRQGSAISLASGGAASFYLVPKRSARPIRWQHEVLAEVVEFCRRLAPFSIGTESVPQVAVLHSAASHYALAEMLDPLNEVALYASLNGTAALKGAVLTLLDLHLHVNLIDDERLFAGADRYGLIAVPEPRVLSPDVLERLVRYVEDGGRLLLTGSNVTELAVDLTGLAPGGELEDGVRFVQVGGFVTGIPGPWRRAEPTTASTIAQQLADQDPEDVSPYPAVSVNRVGYGRVATIPADIFANLYMNRLQRRRGVVSLAIAALEPRLDVVLEAPPSVHVSLRERDASRFVHLVNMGAEPSLSPRKLDVERVPEVRDVALRLRLSARPRRVRLEPEGSLEWSWRDGWLEARIDRLHVHAVLAVETLRPRRASAPGPSAPPRRAGGRAARAAAARS